MLERREAPAKPSTRGEGRAEARPLGHKRLAAKAGGGGLSVDGAAAPRAAPGAEIQSANRKAHHGTTNGTGRTGTFTTETAASDAMCAVLAQNWWLIARWGVFAILFGIIAFAAPGAVMLILALFFAAYLLVDGVIGITAAVRAARAHERWGLLLAKGALNIIMGLIAAVFPVR